MASEETALGVCVPWPGHGSGKSHSRVQRPPTKHLLFAQHEAGTSLSPQSSHLRACAHTYTLTRFSVQETRAQHHVTHSSSSGPKRVLFIHPLMEPTPSCKGSMMLREGSWLPRATQQAVGHRGTSRLQGNMCLKARFSPLSSQPLGQLWRPAPSPSSSLHLSIGGPQKEA